VHLLTLVFSVDAENGGSRWNHGNDGLKGTLSWLESPPQCSANDALNRWSKHQAFAADCGWYQRVNSSGNHVRFAGLEAADIAPASPRQSTPETMVYERRYSTPIRQSFGGFIECPRVVPSRTIEEPKSGAPSRL
jgi:hypothetical protein